MTVTAAERGDTQAMGVVSRVILASPDRVWATLGNGWTYARWVVGTGEIRAVDVDFPAPGARLHYRIGRWPLVKKGTTTVLACDEGQLLELEAEGWPIGTAYVGFSLEPVVSGMSGSVGTDREPSGPHTATQVVITEHPKSGLASALHNPAADQLFRLRNVETLRRLEKAVLGLP